MASGKLSASQPSAFAIAQLCPYSTAKSASKLTVEVPIADAYGK
ncbi:MAG: hypothetical protein SAL70_31880 [Scytonema sp. PMC 1070.18]|nr:hypothetical protein [Scytonema sp. PMC 1070.18]